MSRGPRRLPLGRRCGFATGGRQANSRAATRDCDVKERTLATAWPTFLEGTYGSLRRLCHEVFEGLVDPNAEALFNWHEKVAPRVIGTTISPSTLDWGAGL
jgi:hypothetical protein